VSEAIFGLIGVVIGGLLNGVVLYLMERTRDSRDTRTAARMLLPELRDARRTIKFALGSHHYPFSTIETARWQEWEPVLAPRMGGEEWASLYEIYLGIRLLNDDSAEARQLSSDAHAEWEATGESPPPGWGSPLELGDEDEEWLGNIYASAEDAIRTLLELARVPKDHTGFLERN
jgi:hypothetical protein